MHCEYAQQVIVERLTDAVTEPVSQDLAAHLAGCVDCAAFETRHRALDERLAILLPPLEAGPSSRIAIMRRIESERRRNWPDSLPDLAHFVGWGWATAVCLVVVPLDSMSILTGGAMTALAGYTLLTTARQVLDVDEL